MPEQNKPNLLEIETALYGEGYLHIAGVDEVGRGCLAGPVFAAAVILPAQIQISGVNDSKQLSPRVREKLFEKILEVAVDWSIAFVDHERIDKINIHKASLEVMKKAVDHLKIPPEFVLIDGRFPLDLGIPQRPVIHGDAQSQSIAAASIVAKVLRDRWMCEVAKQFPDFGFEAHKGYGTLRHRRAIQRFGLTPLHRRSFNVS
ncbi:MAG: ribonuclease HII [Deltaproteobacteria bacterium]|nr:ribonuclease HII [Deltaproteobacteria bacterium]